MFRRFSSDTFGEGREFEHRECRSCSLIFVHPAPSAADLERFYSSPRYYELVETERELPDGTRERPEWKSKFYDSFLAEMAAAGCAGGRLLDVGCGWGLFMERAKARGFAVSGIELSPQPAEYVRSRLGLEVSGEGLEKEPPASFDAVTMMDVLEHVTSPREFAAQALRALKPGGWLAVNVPNALGFTNEIVPKLISRLRGRRNVFLQHMSEFRKASLTSLLKSAGFTAISVQGRENWRQRLEKPFPRNAAWLLLSAVGVLLGSPASLMGLARKPS